MRRWHLSVLAGLTVGIVLVGSAVLAASSPAPAPAAVSKAPPELTDRSWANRVPEAAPVPYVKIVQVTVPAAKRQEWEPTLRQILESFVPTEGVYK